MIPIVAIVLNRIEARARTTGTVALEWPWIV